MKHGIYTRTYENLCQAPGALEDIRGCFNESKSFDYSKLFQKMRLNTPSHIFSLHF